MRKLLPVGERVCPKCKRKDVEFYSYNGTCKECILERNRKWVKNNRKDYLSYQKAYRSEGGAGYRTRIEHRDKLKQLILDFKTNKPCADCGQIFHPVCMDFDHKDPETKYRDVSYLAAGGCSEETVKSEMEKCDLVCANCHRLRSVKAGVYPKWYPATQL